MSGSLISLFLKEGKGAVSEVEGEGEGAEREGGSRAENDPSIFPDHAIIHITLTID